MSLRLINFVVQQKLTRHCKVIILQLIRKTKTPPGRAREFSVLASWVFSPHLAGVSDRSPDGGAMPGRGVGDLPHLGYGVGASAQTSLAHVTPGCSTSARYHMALSLPCSHLRTMSPAPMVIPPSPLPRVSSSTQPYPASSVKLSIVCLPHQDVSCMEAGLPGPASVYHTVLLLIAPLCPVLCDPMDCGTAGSLVLHCLPEFVQTHVH